MSGKQTATLIHALQDPSLYDHPVTRFEVIETHISWVILTGSYAYKIKKPLDLGFLDFSTLEKRLFYCTEEVRLNRRLASRLYLGTVTITGTPEAPTLDGSGTPIEYAVKMAQFDQDAQFDRLIEHGALRAAHIDRLAYDIADFHGACNRATQESPFGTPDHIGHPVSENFTQIRRLLSRPGEIERLEWLQAWSMRKNADLCDVFLTRKEAGYIRECHGDMHLANIAMYQNDIVIFDCIEFNENLRWIDVMSEAAFLVMDLDFHRRGDLGFRFLNAYLEQTGDYAGLRVFRYFLVYRAMVRAKVSLLRLSQGGFSREEEEHARTQYRDLLQLAGDYTRALAAGLIITHGVSGSGKTTITHSLLEHLGAIRCRSDVERKRLHGMDLMAKSGSGIDSGLYSAQASRRTYEHLLKLAHTIIASGYTAIIDAAFLRQGERDRFRALAAELGAPFLILDFQAPVPLLMQWIRERTEKGRDVSEAGIQVLENQLATQEALTAAERPFTLTIDTSRTVDIPVLVARIGELIGPGPSG